MTFKSRQSRLCSEIKGVVFCNSFWFFLLYSLLMFQFIKINKPFKGHIKKNFSNFTHTHNIQKRIEHSTAIPQQMYTQNIPSFFSHSQKENPQNGKSCQQKGHGDARASCTGFLFVVVYKNETTKKISISFIHIYVPSSSGWALI